MTAAEKPALASLAAEVANLEASAGRIRTLAKTVSSHTHVMSVAAEVLAATVAVLQSILRLLEYEITFRVPPKAAAGGNLSQPQVRLDS
jgi:hypothetical protein